MNRTHNDWTTHEVRLLALHYPTRTPTKRIYAMLPRHSPGSIRCYAQSKLGLRRPPKSRAPHKKPTWDRMAALLKVERLTIEELALRLGISQQRVSELIGAHRIELYVADWRPPVTRGHWKQIWAYGNEKDVERPFKRRVRDPEPPPNPFLAAAGLVQIPVGAPGRVYKQAMNMDEEEQAA